MKDGLLTESRDGAATGIARGRNRPPGPPTVRGSGGWLLAVLGAVQFMLIVDTVVVVVALPSVQAEFGMDAATGQWTVSAYVLAYGGFMITAGRAADLLGARRTLLAGLALFIAASAACGLAPGATLLFAARALQGLGAALVSPATLALVTTTFAEGGARNRALGLWGPSAPPGRSPPTCWAGC